MTIFQIPSMVWKHSMGIEYLDIIEYIEFLGLLDWLQTFWQLYLIYSCLGF